jgi:anti-anti-sigma regulatory factor
MPAQGLILASVESRMNVSPGSLMIAVVEPVVYLKITGRANFTLSVDFKTAVNGLRDKGFCQYVMDLTECQIMDSTFVGVLAGLSLKLVQAANGGKTASIQILNPNERVSDLLDNLGIAHLFNIVAGASPAAQYTPAASAQASRIDISKTSLEAHETLMQVNPANIPKFKDVAKFLVEDLSKLQNH